MRQTKPFAGTRRAADVLASNNAGPAATARLRSELVGEVVGQFALEAVTAGRWSPDRLPREAEARVDSATRKVIDGRAKGPRPKFSVIRGGALPKADAPPQTKSAGRPLYDAPDGAPVIDADRELLNTVLEEAETALVAAGAGVYQRLGSLVAVPSGADVHPDDLRIVTLDDTELTRLLSSAARWTRYDNRTDKTVRCPSPRWVAEHVLRKTTWARIPRLEGFTLCPTLREDGTLLNVHGYDARTNLFCNLAGMGPVELPGEPTRADAEAALGRLKALVSTFPFKCDVDRAVVLTCFLTAVVRRSLPAAPMFALTSPVPGSGKSKLSAIACVLATGAVQQPVSPGHGEEEFEKRLVAKLLSGCQCIAIDNVQTDLGGPLLNTMLSEPRASARTLGKSESPSLATRVLVTATRNNLKVAGDGMSRRTLFCQIDPGVERPEEREFNFDPVSEALRLRKGLVADCLTIMLAHQAVGAQRAKTTLRGFEAWYRRVRDPLMWLGEADALASLERSRDNDTQFEAMLQRVLSHWHEVVGPSAVTALQVVNASLELKPGCQFPGRDSYAYPEFRDALLSVAGAAGNVDSLRLGKWIAPHKDRIVGGMRVTKAGVHAGTTRWSLRRSDAA